MASKKPSKGHEELLNRIKEELGNKATEFSFGKRKRIRYGEEETPDYTVYFNYKGIGFVIHERTSSFWTEGTKIYNVGISSSASNKNIDARTKRKIANEISKKLTTTGIKGTKRKIEKIKSTAIKLPKKKMKLEDFIECVSNK